MRISDWSSDVCSSDLPAAGAHGKNEGDLVVARPVGRAEFDGVEMAAHIGGIDVMQRNIDTGADAGQLGRRRHDGLGLAEHFAHRIAAGHMPRSEEHTSELQSLMRISYAVFCLKKKKQNKTITNKILYE